MRWTVSNSHALRGLRAGRLARRRVVVKILDLGLALLVGDDQQRLTMFDNRAMGTAMYMSPEQWKTSSVDIRADIYSLGCTLYHLLAGKPPFLESDLKPEKAHEREKLPPIEAPERIPRPLWETLRRMTAKNPAERFATPGEVVAALAPFAEGNHLAESVQQIAWRRRPDADARGREERYTCGQERAIGYADADVAKLDFAAEPGSPIRGRSSVMRQWPGGCSSR